MPDEKLAFTDHLEELRKRFIICLAATGIGFAISYFFSEQIYQILALPVRNVLQDENSFIFTSLTEPFFTYLKLAFFSGIALASPVIISQIWAFVAPGLYKNEKKYSIPFVLLSTLFFVIGVLFCFFVVFPIACTFFAGFAQAGVIEMKLKMSDYLSFSCAFLLAFGLVFELPIFILFLTKIGVVNHSQLTKNRKYVILLAFVASAILTPPDIISQVLMAVPLLILYELSIVLAKIVGKKPSPEDDKDSDTPEESEEKPPQE
jgi:sec-independent protein translocase protein TatC